MHCFPCRKKRKREKGSPTGKTQFISRVEKEYLKPSYSASVGEELEDGLFDGNVETHVISLCSRISCITPFFHLAFILLFQIVKQLISSPADFLELALQFGMIMMFACAFPPAFAFAALVTVSEFLFQHNC